MDDHRLDAYLARIGAARPVRPDAAALRELQARHLLTVPFENLSVQLREPIVLEPAALVGKLVERRRGGFCYELNGAFAALLSGLGFQVRLAAARVFGAAGPGPPFDHLALVVPTGPAETWLVDVGFGRFSQHPLRLDAEGDDQADPAGSFRVTPTADGDLDVAMDGEPQYRLEPRPRRLADFEPTCWWHQTSPKSHFTRSSVCSMATPTGRVTISGRTLIRSSGGERQEQRLGGDAELLAAYRTWFGIELERLPGRARRGRR
jgi:N-hydroxyarylamine O-acetyltransferase